MKKFKKWALVAIGMMTLAVSLGSCSDDDNDYYLRTVPNALVTVKVTGDRCYFQLDDQTTLAPVNVNWIDSILTKKPVPCLATPEENDAKYGHDAVDIVRDWVTIVEDGYLTLRFRALWGNVKPHSINLIAHVNPQNPYEVELRHHTNGDPQLRWGDALVAFDLNDVLPDTQGKKVKLTVKWKSTVGDKTVDFDYCSRKSMTAENNN